MPKMTAASSSKTETVQIETSDEQVTVSNITTGATATAKIPKRDAARATGDPDLSGSLDDEDKYVSVLYYGPYGTGKTTDVLSMTKLPPLEGSGKVLLLNAEAGAKPTALRQHGIDPSRIVPWPPRGQVLTFEGMERLFYKIADELQRDPDSWLGGVWDSTTAIHDFLLVEVVELDLEEKRAILARANSKRAGNITLRDQFLYEGDDYQRMQAKFKDLMRKFRYLPWHFALTSLRRRDEDQKTHRVQYGPAVSPKLQNDVGGGPDVVIRTGTIEGKDGPVWYGRTFATDDEPAKDRYGVLPREMVNPSFDRIVAYVRGDLTEETDPEQRRMPGGTTPETGKRTPTKRSASTRKAEPKQTEMTGSDRDSVEQAMPMEDHGGRKAPSQVAHEEDLTQRKRTAQKEAASRLKTSSAKSPTKTAELAGSSDAPPF